MAELAVRDQQLLLLHFPLLCELASLEELLVSPRAAILRSMRETLQQISLSRLRRAGQEAEALRDLDLDLKYLRFVADGIGVAIESHRESAEPADGRDAQSLELRILSAMRSIAELRGEPREYIAIIDKAIEYFRRRRGIDVLFDRELRGMRSDVEVMRARILAEFARNGRSENLHRVDS